MWTETLRVLNPYEATIESLERERKEREEAKCNKNCKKRWLHWLRR